MLKTLTVYLNFIFCVLKFQIEHLSLTFKRILSKPMVFYSFYVQDIGFAGMELEIMFSKNID